MPILKNISEWLLLTKDVNILVLTNEKWKVRNLSVEYSVGCSLERHLVASLIVYPNMVWHSWYSLIMIKICFWPDHKACMSSKYSSELIFKLKHRFHELKPGFNSWNVSLTNYLAKSKLFSSYLGGGNFTVPVSRYWEKFRRGHFEFPDFCSIPYKGKLP